MSSIPICSICCDKFTANSVVRTTKCGHIFHDSCIRRWLNTNTTCPECRQVASLLCPLYLNFNDAEEEIQSSRTPKKIVSQEIENLVLKLSLEEARRDAAEKCFQENARKLRENTDLIKKKDKEQQKLKLLLEEEKRRRRIAEETEELLRKELYAHQKGSSIKFTQTTSNPNERRTETSNASINFHRRPCHHHSTRDVQFDLVTSVSVLNCRSRNHRTIPGIENIFLFDDILN